jgi:antitoxin CptB
MLELDLLLQGFLKGQYDDLSTSGKKTFEILLAYPDAVLFDLLMGKSVTADGDLASVIKKIRATSAY